MFYVAGNNFYIIVEGEVDVYKSKKTSSSNVENLEDTFQGNANEELLTTLKKGQYFGEKALLKEDVRQASCVSKTSVTCLTLGREDFIDMVGALDDPAAGLGSTRRAGGGANDVSSRKADSNASDDKTKALLTSTTASAEQSVASNQKKYVLSQFTLLRIIGKGAFGHVKIAFYQSTPRGELIVLIMLLIICYFKLLLTKMFMNN